MLGDSPAVLRGPIVSGYIQQLLTQTNWGALDFLIIDMPPGTGDIQLTITQSAPLDGALIVTTPQTLSLVDVAKGILMFEKVEVPVLGLVENMSYFVCDGCSKKHFIFGSSTHTLRERFGIETLAEIPVIPNVSQADGHLIDEPMRILAGNMHRAIGKRRVGAVSPMVTVAPGFLNIRWPDGALSTLPNAKVRASCTCAQCVNEFTGEPILDPASVPEDIAIEDIQQLGNYAVAITWSDGHGSGIYSWDRLRSLTTAAT
jgi:ATP-binding protein involved in chromosome partitioning